MAGRGVTQEVEMAESGFHFAQPAWLWALLAILGVALWLGLSRVRTQRGPVDRYADKHLLPYLTGTRTLGEGRQWGRFWRWSLLWGLAIIAMAGPRWDFADIKLFRSGDALVILLDISRSMLVDDVPGTRIGRARQEIDDLVRAPVPLRYGLIAFASTAHVVSPITEDSQTIRNALPSLSAELVRLQGSRLGFALQRASQLLAAQPEDAGKTVLLISDGDFDEVDIEQRVREMAHAGIRLIVLGVGTPSGGPVPAPDGSWLVDRQRRSIESRLNEDLLQRLAVAGNGVYLRADFHSEDTDKILEIGQEKRSTEKSADDTTRVWNERFYLALLPLLILLLPQFRRHRAR
jgi:Ca-activated chloride channel homolog